VNVEIEMNLVSAAPPPEKEGFVMNPATPKPEGSNDFDKLDANLVEACQPGESGHNHWAFGMPLSYVQEMASHWLSLHDQTARLVVPVSENRCDASPQTGDD
jgi:hypothetical protein